MNYFVLKDVELFFFFLIKAICTRHVNEPSESSIFYCLHSSTFNIYKYVRICYKSWSGLPLTRLGPRPVQYLEDGEMAEA